MKIRHGQRHRLGGSVWFVLLGLAAGVYATAAGPARPGATVTALDRYIAKPDTAYAWRKVAEWRDAAATGYAIDMTSQQWLTPAEVDRTEWPLWLRW